MDQCHDVFNTWTHSNRYLNSDTVKVQLYACEKFMQFLKIWPLNKFMRFLFMRCCQLSIFINNYTIYNEKYFSGRQFSYIVRVITWGHGYASWMRPVAMRKSALQGSGLVRTVGPCAWSRVPRVIATASKGCIVERSAQKRCAPGR